MMTYLLKVNLIWILLTGLYMLLLRRDTFFSWKRFTLLGIYAAGWLLPLTEPGLWHDGNEAVAELYINLGLIDIQGVPTAPTEKSLLASIAWSELLLWGVYLCGVSILLVRLLVQLISICRLRLRSTTVYINKVKILEPTKPQPPFSFFGWIFLSPSRHTPEEQQEILDHELAHVHQHHSIDVLLTELHCIVCWLNPIVWLMKHEVRSNLEYLADARVLAQGHNRKGYQIHLLALSYPMAIANLYNHFNVSPLKKRINMMNKKKSSNAGILKYLLILPLCALISLVINADAWATTLPQQEKKNVTYSGTVVYTDGNKLANVRIAEAKKASTSLGEKFLGTTDEQGRFSVTVPEGTSIGFIYMYEKDGKGTDHVYQVVDEMPQFPGGNRAMMAYIGQNIKYPAEAVAKGIEGRVLVQFVVNKEGDLQDIKVMKSIDSLLDQEAIRVISSMPKWTPGKLKGEAVNIQYVLPIQFNIPKKAQQK
ncbi:MAG: TonB family protein [Bacteroides sp.]